MESPKSIATHTSLMLATLGWSPVQTTSNVMGGTRSMFEGVVEQISMWVLHETGSFEDPNQLSIQGRAAVRVAAFEDFLAPLGAVDQQWRSDETAAVLISQVSPLCEGGLGFVIDASANLVQQFADFKELVETDVEPFFAEFRAHDWYERLSSRFVDCQIPVDWEVRRVAAWKRDHSVAAWRQSRQALVEEARGRARNKLQALERRRNTVPIPGLSSGARVEQELKRLESLLAAVQDI